MLTTNSRNDKLTAAHADFSTCGMLNGTCLGEALRRLCDPDEGITGDGDDVEDDLIEDGNSGRDLDADEDEEEEEATGPVDGSPILSEASLALKRGNISLPF
jgi:hypothetical protein